MAVGFCQAAVHPQYPSAHKIGLFREPYGLKARTRLFP